MVKQCELISGNNKSLKVNNVNNNFRLPHYTKDDFKLNISANATTRLQLCNKDNFKLNISTSATNTSRKRERNLQLIQISKLTQCCRITNNGKKRERKISTSGLLSSPTPVEKEKENSV